MTRVGTCEREGCDERFVDTSGQQARRFCSDRCRKLQHAGNPRCEVCGVSLTWGTSLAHVPTRCLRHTEDVERRKDAGRARTERAIELRRQGLLNDEIADEMGGRANDIAVLLNRASRYGLEVPPTPYRGAVRGARLRREAA